ncbi:hypothetical protein BGAPBR_D0004 (plasmid) [Borreliella garinii PBr]|uniref:Uncharacterized protein n=1 Tax=Borreliella garinii PBr TaxID=498743 RepID=B8F1Q2_BORGR|nr:hypothetical protein BGAPBR_D0004 [Borreliella garinii PBr]
MFLRRSIQSFSMRKYLIIDSLVYIIILYLSFYSKINKGFMEISIFNRLLIRHNTYFKTFLFYLWVRIFYLNYN